MHGMTYHTIYIVWYCSIYSVALVWQYRNTNRTQVGDLLAHCEKYLAKSRMILKGTGNGIMSDSQTRRVKGLRK